MHKFISPLALAALTASVVAHAALAFDRPDDWRRHRPEGRDRFMLGVCVGQTLAAQGVTLPTPQAGQPPAFPDATTQQAIDSAIQSCRAEFSGASPSPDPSASASASPSPDPTATSTPMPTPAPAPSASSDPTTSSNAAGD